MSQVAPGSPSHRIALPALTGVRFVAAFYVLIFHIFATLRLSLWRPLDNVLGAGYTAVTFFFVLSGFILSVCYAGPGLASPGAIRAFYLVRFFRVYPCYLAAFFASVIAVLCCGFTPQEPPSLPSAFASALGVQAFHPAWARSWNTPGWSVSVEIACYLAFPAVLTRARRLGPRALLSLFGCAWATGLAFFLPGLVDRSFDTLAWHNFVKFSPVARFPELVCGVALGLVYLDDRRVGRARRGSWLVAVGLLISLVVLAQSDIIPKPIMHNGLLVPPIAMVILGLAHGGGAVGKVLSTGPMVALGGASYALYIFQLPLGAFYIAAFKGVLPLLVGAVLYVPTLLLASWVIYRWFEAPIRTWGVLRVRRAVGEEGEGSP